MIISQKYEVLSQIGQGSMGVVYRVRHTALETISALKVLPRHFTDNPELVKRFYREARVLARMNHPNIVRVIDIHEDKELQSHYIVMEYIEGITLRAHLTETGPLPVRHVIKLAKQVADALSYAHLYDPPVIHRDIKPTNIMIEERSDRVVVMDFGIAKDMGDSDMTKAGTVLGTLRYCPPEQMRYEDLDGSADVYALGMVIYEAHTGSHPFAGLGEYSVVARVLDAQEYQIDFPADTPPSFRSLVKRAVAKDRAKRYRSMAELLKDLDACWFDLDETIPAVEIQPPPNLDLERERRSVQRLEEELAEHKDRAALEGAAQLAATLFEHACALEEQGQKQFQQKEYAHARTSYEKALASFKEAYQQARNEASQARDQTAAARVKADRSGAKDKARTYYSQGLALQTQADELWEHRSFSEACQLYGKASSLFEEADVLAKNLLQEQLTQEVEEVQARVRKARDVAVKESVEEYAAEAFWEAVRSERQGDTALAQEDYQLARDILSQALAQYEQARRQAQYEQQHREAVTGQRETELAQAGAVAEGATAEQPVYRQAEETHQRGDEQLAQQSYLEAAQSYQQARSLYEQSTQEAKRNRQQQDAQQAREQAEQSRAQALEAGARERFESGFAQAERYWNEGCECEKRNAHVEAQKAFEQATDLWAQLQADLRSQRLREEAEALRTRLLEVKEGPPSLRGLAKSAWATADRRARDAETAFGGGRYADAVTLYDGAVQAFRDARSAAEQARAERQARTAQEESARAETAAQNLEASRYSRDAYLRGQKLQQDADRALTARHWSEAERGFREAAAVYQESGTLAKNALAREAAEAARTSALSARAQVSREIEGVFQDKLSAASELFDKGEQALRQQEYERAQEILEQTAAAFLRIQEEGLRHLQQQQAERARTQALRLDEETGDARGWSLRRARKALQQAHRSYDSYDYPQAATGYEKAAELYVAWQQKAQQSSPKLYLWLAVLVLLVASGGVYLSRLTPEPEKIPIPTPTPLPSPTLPQAVPQTTPPSLLKVIPDPDPANPVVLAEGARKSFSVTPQQGTDPASLRYRWLLDGVPQTDEANWTYAPEYDAASSKLREVKVIITGPQDRTAEIAWGVEVVNVNREPELIHALPESEALTPKPGETISFEVQGMDPDRDDQLSYLWTLDGKRVAEDQKWVFKADPAGSHQRVQVAIVDPGGLSASKTWEVEVAPAEPTPSPLRIVKGRPDSPPDAVITLKEGGEQRFSVDVSGGSGRPLRYLWYLDGRQQAKAPEWTYRPDSGQGGDKTKRIQVRVSDPQGSRVERFWRVRVEDVNRPPRIVGISPQEGRLDIASGSSRRFSIEAADTDRTDALQYAWLLNGKLLGRESSFDFPNTIAPGKHTLEARVSDPAQATVTQRWSVAVLAPAAPPPPPKKAPAPTIEEAEVKAWLGSYKSAWESKDVNALIGLGEVTNANAAKLHGVLAGYRDFRVELKALQIQIDGTRAQVSFQREDVINGKRLVQPGRKVYVFVKQPNGNLDVTR